MATKWDPRTKPPDDTARYGEWLVADLELFRKSRAEFLQGALGARARNKLIRAWNAAREAAELEDAAKVSPEYYQAVKRFHRTRTITLPLKKTKMKKARPKKSRRDKSP